MLPKWLITWLLGEGHCLSLSTWASSIYSHLHVFATWQLASTKVTDPRESEQEAAKLFMKNFPKSCTRFGFYFLSVRSESVHLAHLLWEIRLYFLKQMSKKSAPSQLYV